MFRKGGLVLLNDVAFSLERLFFRMKMEHLIDVRVVQISYTGQDNSEPVSARPLLYVVNTPGSSIMGFALLFKHASTLTNPVVTRTFVDLFTMVSEQHSGWIL